MKKWPALLFAAALIVSDQLIKLWAIKELGRGGQIEVIPGLFNLTYIENRGAAFGIFQDKTLALSIVSAAVLAVILAALIMGKFESDFLIWTVSIGIAGGIGNLYDRVARGFVVDYLDFSTLFGFPVFNLADCCVVIATGLILIYVIKNDSAQSRRLISNDDEA